MAARLSVGGFLARAEAGREGGREEGRPTAWLRPPIVMCLGLLSRAASAALHGSIKRVDYLSCAELLSSLKMTLCKLVRGVSA